MLATLLAASSVCVASVLIGQLVCAAAGAVAWASSAPAVGLGALVGLSVPGLHVPGHTTGPLLLVLGLSVGGVWLLWTRPDHRPPVGVAVPVFLASAAVLVPFIAARRFGTLGVSIDDDMAGHLMLSGAFLSTEIARVAPALNLSIYPLGPHGVSAMIASAWRIGLADSFTGFTIALPPLIVLTVWGHLRALPRGAAQLASFVVATAYLVLAYMGEGSFKEPAMVVLLFGMVGEVADLRSSVRAGRGRFLPMVFILLGLVSVYSVEGLWWPAVIVGALIATSLLRWSRAGHTFGWGNSRSLLAPSVLGLCAFVLLIAPQLSRLSRFYSGIVAGGVGSGSGIPVSNLGNLYGPLDPLEVTGSWLSANFRQAPPDIALSVLGALIIVGCALIGSVRLARRGRLELPLATASCGVIWVYSSLTQSPYTSAKALVISSPFVLCLAAIGLWGAGAGVGWGFRIKGVISGCVLLIVGASGYLALTSSSVGPSSHAVSMARFRPIVSGRTTFVFEYNSFVDWYLAGARVNAPGLGSPLASPGRPWKSYERFGWGSATATALQHYEYVVAPNDPGSGQPPPDFKLVRISGPYALFRRVSSVSGPADRVGRSLVGNCLATDHHQLQWVGDQADPHTQAIREPVRGTAEGAVTTADLPALGPGRYYVNLRYVAYEPVRISMRGLSVTLPATLEGLGTYWPVGPLVLTRRSSLTVRIAEGSGLINARAFGLENGVLQLTKLRTSPHGCERVVTGTG